MEIKGAAAKPASETIVGGLNPVLEALKARGQACRQLLVAEGRGGRGAAEIMELARGLGLKIKSVRRDRLDQLYGSRHHQGLAAVFDPFVYTDLDHLSPPSADPAAPGLLIILDRVEDPRNLGAIMRSASAMGARGLVIPHDRAVSVTGAALAAAAGAAEYLPVARVASLAGALRKVKNMGYWLVGAEGGSGEKLDAFEFPERTALILGSESRGLSPLVRKKCDFLVHIPLIGPITSLNVSAAGAIFIYEYTRQRGLRPA